MSCLRLQLLNYSILFLSFNLDQTFIFNFNILVEKQGKLRNY